MKPTFEFKEVLLIILRSNTADELSEIASILGGEIKRYPLIEIQILCEYLNIKRSAVGIN